MGLPQDLADRVLASLSDERGLLAKKNAVRKHEVAKVADDTYRKMQISGAVNLASKSQGFSDSVNVNSKEAVVDFYQTDKIRCLYGSPQPTDSMMKFEDPRCNMCQHIACMVIPEKPEEGLLPSPPEIFYCETCRLNLADPGYVLFILEASDDVRFST
ncbi:SUMO ligase siz1 [Orobanche hederae]